jgi:hypothetical protein
MTQPNNITFRGLASDINALRALTPSALAGLSDKRPQSSPTAPYDNAVETLGTTTINTSTPDQRQALAKAYIKAMRKDVLGVDRDANEEMGNRLDELRGRAEGISEALGGVKA